MNSGHISKFTQKLKEENFNITRVKAQEDIGKAYRLQEAVYVSELGCNATLIKEDAFEAYASRYLVYIRGQAIGTLRLVNPQLKKGTALLPIQSYIDLAVKSKSIMEISRFLLLKQKRGRSYCSAMIACCYAYAQKHKIDLAFVTTLEHADALFDKVGFKAYQKPVYIKEARQYATPRMINIKDAKHLTDDLAESLLKNKIIML